MGAMDVPVDSDELPRLHALARTGAFAKYTRVLSSPLERCLTTASVLAGGAVEVEVDPRLRERSLGRWEGMSRRSVEQRFPESFLADSVGQSAGAPVMDARATPPEGEPFGDFCGRISDLLDELRRLPAAEGPVLVVTHNGWIRTAQYLCGAFEDHQIYRASAVALRPVRLSLDRMGTVH